MSWACTSVQSAKVQPERACCAVLTKPSLSACCLSEVAICCLSSFTRAATLAPASSRLICFLFTWSCAHSMHTCLHVASVEECKRTAAKTKYILTEILPTPMLRHCHSSAFTFVSGMHHVSTFSIYAFSQAASGISAMVQPPTSAVMHELLKLLLRSSCKEFGSSRCKEVVQAS